MIIYDEFKRTARIRNSQGFLQNTIPTFVPYE